MRHSRLTAACASLVAACALTACADSPPQPVTAAVVALAQRRSPSVVITALPSRDTLGFGDVMQLGAQAVDGSGRTRGDQSLTWSSSDSMVALVTDAGIVIAGRRGGTVRIYARLGQIEGHRVLTVRARATRDAGLMDAGNGLPAEADVPLIAGPWTFCSGIGANCEFLGLRDVRLIFASGVTVRRTAYGRVHCSVDGFGDPDPKAGKALRCEYGTQRRQALVNPMPETFGMGATTVVPSSAPGSAEERIRPSAVSGLTADGSGTFRTRCDPATIQFNDPLGNPGRVNASPLQLFFGNTSVGGLSHAATVSRSGNSTCRGGVLDRSVYYTPALIDTRHGDVQVPADGVIYYRTGENMDPLTIQPMPVGLVMIAGDRNARGIQQRTVEWLCRDKFVTNTGMIPDCGVGDQVQLWVHFPQCWDGRQLDSRDHRSHLAYPVLRDGVERSFCPLSHPVALPQMTQVIQYNVRAGASLANWRLSTDAYGSSLRGGLSAHAHWINGWNPLTMRALVRECLNRAADCNGSSLGNGTALY